MAEIVNLRQVRKRKARVGREAEAERNRAVHGQTKSERDRLRRQAELDAARLDAHRRGEPDR